MSKTFSALEKIQEERKEKSFTILEENRSSSALPSASSSEKQTDRMIKMSTIAWLAVSITATVFSYTLGVRQGMQQAQVDSPKQWLYYFTESQETSEAQKSAVQAKKAESGIPATPLKENVQAAAAVTETAPAPAAAEVPKQGFTIQVVTYAGAQKAQQEVQKLIQKGHSAFVIPSGKYYQVCIESFGDKKTAAQKLTKLRTDGYQKTYPGAFVRPVRH